MDVDRQLVSCQPFIDWKQLFAVQRFSVKIREAANAPQSQLVDTSLQLIERILNRGRRQGEKSDKALRIFPANCRDGIVRDPRKSSSIPFFETVRPRSWNGQNMDIDAQLIHVLYSATNILPLEGRGIDPTAELFVIKISHAAVRIGRL